MFRNEKTVPKMSLASSSALRDVPPGPALFDCEVGREDLLLIDVGRPCQRRL
jgi:hypothetical protein